jgi:cell division protein FtsL
MHKLINAVLVLAALVAGFMLYSLEHDTRRLERTIAASERRIAEARESIRLLRAEWSSLTRPDRLQKLAAEHLRLKPLAASQIVRLEELGGRVPPAPVVKLEAADRDPIGDILRKMQ